MPNVRTASGAAALRPRQAAPVLRDGPAPAAGRGGITAAAADPCGRLTGIARQMCYADRYGLRT